MPEKNNGYVYAVTRVHAHETGLLTKEDIHALQVAPLHEALTILYNKGWGAAELPEGDLDALLQYETRRVWDLMHELLKEENPFDVFRITHDYNNLKAAIKLVYSGLDHEDVERYFLPFGAVPPEQLLEAARAHDFSDLPVPMAEAGQAAYESLLKTANGQNCDAIIDRTALVELCRSAGKTRNALLQDYAELTADIANIKIAVRGNAMGKELPFFHMALAPCGSLNIEKLAEAALESLTEILAYLAETSYSTAVKVLTESLPAFEVWANNKMIEKIRPQRHAISGLEPLAAFMIARENEIAMVRLVLSAKVNQIPPHAVEQRMREMYE